MKPLKISHSINPKSEPSLQLYFKDISKFEVNNAENESNLIALVRSGDPLALNKLIVHNLRFVVSVAKQYQNRGLSLQDLISEGNLGLMKAAQNYDETRGFKFISYAVWWIRQAILLAITDQGKTIRLPSNQIAIVNKISEVINELNQNMGREANLLEIAEALEMSPKKLERILQDASETISLSEESPYTGETLASNIIDSDGVRPDEALNNESFKNQISQALSKLDTTSALIIQLYYGIDKDRTLTLEEIAPIVGLTKERVRQIKKKAMESIHMRRLKGL